MLSCDPRCGTMQRYCKGDATKTKNQSMHRKTLPIRDLWNSTKSQTRRSAEKAALRKCLSLGAGAKMAAGDGGGLTAYSENLAGGLRQPARQVGDGKWTPVLRLLNPLYGSCVERTAVKDCGQDLSRFHQSRAGAIEILIPVDRIDT